MINNNYIDLDYRINTPAEEAYRTLRTNIRFLAFNDKIKTIAVTSYNQGEGKSTTSKNLGISFASAGKKTLLIDGDLRKPALLKEYISLIDIGLTNYLSSTESFNDIIKQTNIPNFFIIPCGPKPPNPAELVGSAKFKQLLNESEEKFDIIIIDTPPLGSVIDCAIIASQTDGVILVIEADKADYKKVQRVKEQLEKANARILGVVLNKMKKNEYKSYYSFYNYYGKER